MSADARLILLLRGPVRTIVNGGEKLRRNKPCPCGSGVKFKRCCLPAAKASGRALWGKRVPQRIGDFK